MSDDQLRAHNQAQAMQRLTAWRYARRTQTVADMLRDHIRSHPGIGVEQAEAFVAKVRHDLGVEVA